MDDIRAALARYDTPQAPEQTDELRRQVGYAWLSYQHAHYGQLVRVLPGLLDAVQGARSPELLVQAYRITSSLLVKLGEADLAWLAADRAMSAAGDDPILAATAAISVAQALRASSRDRLALTATLAAANRILPAPSTWLIMRLAGFVEIKPPVNLMINEARARVRPRGSGRRGSGPWVGRCCSRPPWPPPAAATPAAPTS